MKTELAHLEIFVPLKTSFEEKITDKKLAYD